MHTSMMMTVNSPPVPHRDITGASTASYRPYNEDYASVQRQLDRPIQTEIDVERTKKDKKWSIGKLFRRKKKDEESGSSSQTDEGGTRSPSKKKSKKKKRTPAVNNFDHIVIRDGRRAQSLANSNIRDNNDDGVLSDPSAGFIKYKDKQETYSSSKESMQIKDNISRAGKGILETPSRKKRKTRLKARVEALRNSMRGESSSDEESLKSSSNSSSMIRFRSDDSLMRSRDSSLNKRSRSARNERYIKRLSRDEENLLNKEAELLQQGYTKAEVEMLTRTPTSQSSGYGTCKRDTTSKIASEPVAINDINRRPLKSESVSSFPSTQSYPSSINFNAKVNNERINYSIQYPNNNTNRGSLYLNNNRESSVSNQYETPENIMCVKFPLGNVTNIAKEEKAPPVPPPRDMHRKVVTPLSMYYDNNSAVADRRTNYNVKHGVPNNDFERIMRRSQERLVGYGLNGLRRPISNSEDHIAIQNNENIQNYMVKNEQPRRPASVSAEPNHYGSFVNSPPWRKQINQTSVVKPEPIQLRQDYLYYADQSPRSRRPISIKNTLNGVQNQYLSDSQVSVNANDKIIQRPRNASEFWKKIDDAERQRKQQNIFANSRSSSEYTNSSQMNKSYPDQKKSTWNKFRDNTESADNLNKSKSIDIIDGARVWKATTEYKRSTTVEPQKTVSPPPKTHIRHKSDTYVSGTYQMPSDDEKSSERRKSTNLDDALNELEAIYNSLGLGDEDLLDRAERRELMTPKFYDHLNDWNGNDDDVQLRSQPSTPLRRISRRSTLPDKLQDDMAFRRMNSFSNKEKPNHKDAQAQISYMLASPVYVPYASDDDKQSERNEPDVVFDDVVYRNIKQTNNRLKTVDPQPPFGIPVGPISPAPQSDYLHATPENKGRSRFVPKRSPDIVADDLAYRSLRKDSRHSSLFNGESYNGYFNNNSYAEFPYAKDSAANIKKKRAVRSLSANIFTMIQKEIDDALNISKMPPLQKTNSNSDVMKRLRDTFEKNDNQKEYCPRNKVKQRHHTVNLFANSTHTPSHHFAKDDSFIYNDDICLAKPPSCDKSKSSSPSNRSPQTSKRSSKDEFQQVLSMLAQEAMDTSNKLGVALAELDKNRNKNEISDIQNRISDSRTNFLNGLTAKTCANSINEVNQNSEKSQQTLDTEEKSRAKRTEDSLLLISDQLNKVEDQLKCTFDKEVQLKNESSKVCNKDNLNKQFEETETSTLSVENSIIPDIVPQTSQNENVVSDTTFEGRENRSPPRFNSLNPFLNTDDKVKELNEIKAFKELKDGISDLIAGIAEVNEKLFVSKSSKVENNEPQANQLTTTKCSETLNEVATKESHIDSSNRASISLSIYEDDIENKKDTADSTEYNSSEELATIFKHEFNKETQSNNNDSHNNNDEKERNNLNSPNLVKTMSQNLRRFSVDESTSQSNNTLPTTVVPWRAKRQNNNSQNENKGDNTKSKRNWHDSGTLMLACSYTLMFSQHLADLDWLTLLGLLLAMITIIAMLII
ncbi:probable serine/threonine-protein kinase DDB_G0282963 isoform X2 [Vanessa cardui]|uniref:probable serine/threonine-protein kinase DDB_G0282963 isoform X2 n=1 Tax=Vanessa cardui TaxID=171605 RepID=UPI001F13D7BF|nr:probable serine/threonine-protein kinase DDB_G0282963 isoform X2 [Vanessa cardui]